jgi:outer membrane protein TolC
LKLALLALLMQSAVVGRAQTAPSPSSSDGNVTTLTVTGLNRASSASPSNQEPTAPSVTVKLDDLIREALDRNPSVKAAAHAVLAGRARVPQMKSLPDPEVTTGWMGNIAPYSVQRGDPSSYRGIGAMQELPFPGKLKLKGEIADREAEALRQDLENTRRNVVAEIKAAYYEYAYYYKAVEITQKDQDLLARLAKIADAQYRVGKGIQQDVLRAQVEQSRLLQRLTVLKQQERTARVRLNTLLNRDPETPIGEPAPIQKPNFPYTLDEIYQMARASDPGLKREQRMVEKSQLAVNLARRDAWPDFKADYMYQERPTLPGMQGFTVGINVPIFYKTKQRQEVIEATEDMIGARNQLEDRQNSVNFEAKQQYLSAKASEELVQLYGRAVVPQSSLALDSSISSYEVGKLDFLSVLSNFQTILEYEVDYYEELMNFETALARLEVLVGRELTQ